MYKKHMTPLTPKGDTTVHQGKGSQAAAMPDRAQITGLAGGSMNDYAKATPSPIPAPSVAPMGGFGLGG